MTPIGKMVRLNVLCDIVNEIFPLIGKKSEQFFAIDFQWDTVVVKWLAGMWDWQQSVFSTFSPTGNAFLSQQVKNLTTSRNNNHPMGQQQLGVQRSVFMWGFGVFLALLKKTFFHRAKQSWIDFSYTSTQWWNANGALKKWTVLSVKQHKLSMYFAAVEDRITAWRIDSEWKV